MLWEHDFGTTTCHSDQLDFGHIYSIEKFYDATQELNVHNPFRVVDLHLSTEDLQALKQFEITNIQKDEERPNCAYQSQCLYQIDQLQNLYYTSSEYLKSISPDSNPELLSHIAGLIANIANSVMLSIPKDFILLTGLRATLPTNEITMDWHVDGEFDSMCILSNADQTFTLLVTLKGQHTLYYTGSHAENSSLPITDVPDTDLNNDNFADELNKLTLSPANTFSTSFGFGTTHTISQHAGAIHSTPQINELRLLLLFVAAPASYKSTMAEGLEIFYF